VQQWGAERIAELAALVGAAVPEEDLTPDELLTALYDQPGVVLGPADGSGALALGVGRDAHGTLVAAVRLIVVRPDRRREGLGTRLLELAESWALERRARRLELGGLLPFALWPGVDPAGPLAALAASHGYVDVGGSSSFAVPASFRAPVPEGVTLRRAVGDDDHTAVTLAVAAMWPRWSDEVARALDHGTCHGAFATSPTDPEGRGREVVGLGCHSITRATSVGPLVVHPNDRRRGIGAALLGQICRDLMIADFPAAEVPGVDDGDVEVEGFLVAAGATVRRRHRRMVKHLDG